MTFLTALIEGWMVPTIIQAFDLYTQAAAPAAVPAQVPPLGVNVAYDINLTTILTFVGGSIVFYIGVVQMRVKQQLLEKKHDELDKRLADYIAAHNALSHQLTTFKESIQHQLQNFVTWESVQKLEERLSTELGKSEQRMIWHFEELGRRIDRAYQPPRNNSNLQQD